MFGSNSGLFRAPGLIVSPVGKGEKKNGRKGKGIENERKEGIRSKKLKEGRKKELKKERRRGSKKEFKKKMSSAGFRLVRSVLLVFLSVKMEGVVGGIGFTFLPS